MRIAREVRDPGIKVELLQVAAQFKTLAEHARDRQSAAARVRERDGEGVGEE